MASDETAEDFYISRALKKSRRDNYSRLLGSVPLDEVMLVGEEVKVKKRQLVTSYREVYDDKKNAYSETKEMSDPNKQASNKGHGHGYPSTTFADLPPARWSIKKKIIVEALQFYSSSSSPLEKKVQAS
ncbi:unnamed protein product [Dovyalis caffra]|uniref:Uncharacterized protein n=1 Tax=Dovyalis caffra TaxID=77055 RepID=A0AAV1SNE4_9ROSI|nr:unnamed protein product [Dovyalis caffra]